MYTQTHTTLIGPPQPLVPGSADQPPPAPPVTEISGAARELAEGSAATKPTAAHSSAENSRHANGFTNGQTAPNANAANNAAQPPREAVPAGLAGAGGQAVTLGAVVVRVNNQPIFADKVLQAIAPVLAPEARQRDPDSFRKFAAHEIDLQLKEMIRS